MRSARRLILASLLCLAATATAAAAASAQERRDDAVYDFYVKGFRVGLLVFAGVQAGDYYAVNGRFQTAGLAALVRNIRYDATVRGRIRNGRFHPRRYVLTTDPGKGQRVQTITFSHGVPGRPSRVPPRHARNPLAVKPAAQAGAVDALTAIYATLRQMPVAAACRGSIIIYDGVRRARLTLWPADGAKGTLACGGEYRRVAGYSAEDMKRPSFPFRMTYDQIGGGQVEVKEIDMESIYGRASLKRR
jgi:hypothetical protein